MCQAVRAYEVKVSPGRESCPRTEQGKGVFIGTRQKRGKETLRIYAEDERIYAGEERIYAHSQRIYASHFP